MELDNFPHAVLDRNISPLFYLRSKAESGDSQFANRAILNHLLISYSLPLARGGLGWGQKFTTLAKIAIE